jgi:hypothetical protein
MKSMIIDEDLHRILKILSAEKTRSIRSLICEALIDLFRKHNKEIPKNIILWFCHHIRQS